ncbi:SAM-dependent methyltransferase [Amycolatopsis nigrescens]|uniref:SAM-dependent methyltransferase n=1 Tax=Amycolatopsis nigrescens TaxID=381445 RepID=UPI00037E86F4|nr:SAM-dependent methyltransferase [Amycolatopsis nigrescens]
MEDVSYTAQWTAAVRALETAREEDRLFTDEYAHILAEPKGYQLLERYRGGGVAEFVTVRTHYFDLAIVDVVQNTSIRQIVLVAGGMDTRAHRLEWPAGSTIFELDHEALLREKQRRLAPVTAGPKVACIPVGVDLATSWSPVLEQAGFDPSAPTLWLVEGLLFFLTEAQAAGLLDTIAAISASGSRLVVDMINEELLRHPMTQSFLATLRDDGTPWLFGTDDPAGFLSRHGSWQVDEVLEPGQFAADTGRWPYPCRPRQVKGVPRSWLVRATLDLY